MLAKLTARGIVASIRRDGVRFAFHVYNTLDDVHTALRAFEDNLGFDGAFMKVLAGGCRVYSPEDGQVSTLGNWTARKVISRNNGAERITQTVNDYAAGVSPAVVIPNAEEALYVAAGDGVCHIDGYAYPAATRLRRIRSSGRRVRDREPRPRDASHRQRVLPGRSAAPGCRRRRRTRPVKDPDSWCTKTSVRRFGPARIASSVISSTPISAAGRSLSSPDGFRPAKRRSITTPTRKAFSFWKAAESCMWMKKTLRIRPRQQHLFPGRRAALRRESRERHHQAAGRVLPFRQSRRRV